MAGHLEGTPPASGVRTALVVGGGIAGLSTAWSLARRGIAVDLVEQGPLPNPKNSSYDEHRINRHAYGRLEGYARLMPAAYRQWDLLWRDLGACHYEETGGLYVLRGDDGWHEATARQLDAMGVGHREVPRAAWAERLPMIEPDGVERVVSVDGSGLLFPVRILTDLVVRLAAMGVRLHAGTRVAAVDPERGAVTTADGRVLSADVVVVAAGAWIDRLVPALKGAAVPSRQAVIFLAPPADLAETWARAPVIVVRDAEDGLYTLPPRRGTRLKIGDHRFSRTGDADEDRAATAADVARLWRGLRKCFRDIGRYAVLEEKACFYTVTEDESFAVRPIGPRGWAVSACSGHGFKLGPLVGEGVARAVAGEAEAGAVSAWLAGRGDEPGPSAGVAAA